MNASRVIIGVARRSYGVERRWKRYSNPGVQKRLNLVEDDTEHDIESVETMDVDDEPDFMKAHESYSEYKHEMAKNKELLKLRIVSRKYFNESEPGILTYGEKEQIRYLHNSDPVVYTPENLSESFPALPHTIKKILRAKWTPKSADRILKHDQGVIENWKKFKRGELPVEPGLREHLKKFKSRIINLPNKEELEKKIIPPEKTFRKPKSQLYSGITQRYLDRMKDNEDNSNNEEKIVSIDDKNTSDSKNRISDENFHYKDLTDRPRGSGKNNSISKLESESEIAILGNGKSLTSVKTKRATSGGGDIVTLDEFFEDRAKIIDSNSPSIEDRVLLDTYRKKMESETVKGENIDRENRLRSKNFRTELRESNSKELQFGFTKEDGLESMKDVEDPKELEFKTYVKLWEKKANQEEEYPETIKIPKVLYKKDKLYKLKDCYYDHDGEFLYRVPGYQE